MSIYLIMNSFFNINHVVIHLFSEHFSALQSIIGEKAADEHNHIIRAELWFQ